MYTLDVLHVYEPTLESYDFNQSKHFIAESNFENCKIMLEVNSYYLIKMSIKNTIPQIDICNSYVFERLRQLPNQTEATILFDQAITEFCAKSDQNPQINSYTAIYHPFILIFIILIFALPLPAIIFCIVRFYYVKHLIKISDWERKVLVQLVNTET